MRRALEYDVILIDSPPLLQTPEASIIAGIADANLIVGRAGALTRDDAHRALERLATANAKTLGVIVSDARERRASYGYGNERRARSSAHAADDLARRASGRSAAGSPRARRSHCWCCPGRRVRGGAWPACP